RTEEGAGWPGHDRLRVPAGEPPALDEHRGHRGAAVAVAPRRQEEAARTCRRAVRTRGTQGLRETLAARAFRRHAAACLDRAGAVRRSRPASDGRAMRRARRADPDAPQLRTRTFVD